MGYCTKCGRLLDGDDRFCPECGAPASPVRENFSGSRREVWEGALHKCPSCGAVVGSFEACCPVCGNELRDKEAVHSVSELSERLDEIESERGRQGKRKGLFAISARSSEAADIDQRKISLIKTYPIPNTIEDILEFVILASSNVEPRAYNCMSPAVLDRAVSDAWLAKCDQAISKAEILAKGSPIVEKMRELLGDARGRIRREKRKGHLSYAALIVIPLLILLLTISVINLIDPNREANEVNRLEGIVASIEQDLEDGEYYRALLNAESLEAASYVSKEVRRQWEVNREYWVDRVKREARENDADLPDQDDEPSRADDVPSDGEERAGGFLNGFVDGFTNAIESSGKEVQKNVEEFNEIMSAED